MKTNKIRKLLGVAALTLGIVASPMATSIASANTGGGIGGGGGPGGAYSGFQWMSVAYAEKGKAYNEFVNKHSKHSVQTTETQIRARVGNLDVCKNSNVIWFIASQGWTYNFTGVTWPTNPLVAGTIENPHSRMGERAPSAAEVQAFRDWDRNQNGHRVGAEPGYTIICSGAFSKPDEKWYSEQVVSRPTETSSYSDRQPYSYSTDVAPQPLSGATGDEIGKDNLNIQSTEIKKTKFGELYDAVNTEAGRGITPDDLRARVKDAKIRDGSTERDAVNLNAKNKEGMAEGGVLNVSERTRWATITTTQTINKERIKGCDYIRRWNPSTGNYNAAEAYNCREWDRETGRSSSSSKAIDGAAQQTGFWQMLSVHCNLEEFNALMASDPSIQRISGNEESGAITAVVHSKKYNQQPSKLDFGDAGNGNAAKAKTGHLGFYDKECPFDCVPVGGSGGNAKSENSSGNNFEFFRDNSAKEISVTPWAPKNVSGVTHDGKTASTTTVTRWNEGTPSIEGVEGGKFTMKTADGTNLFSANNNKTLPVQKNWNTTTFNNKPNAAVLSGQHTDFTVSSTWASAEGKPQAMNIKWEYAPSVSSNIAVNGVGFNRYGEARVDGYGTVAAPIEGKCYGQFGTSVSLNTVDAFGSSTGTGSTNTLDGNLIEGVGSDPKTIKSNLVTNFVRATTE